MACRPRPFGFFSNKVEGKMTVQSVMTRFYMEFSGKIKEIENSLIQVDMRWAVFRKVKDYYINGIRVCRFGIGFFPDCGV